MRVMLTGATGYIGGHTAAALARAGHEVIALVRSPERLQAMMDAFGLPLPRHVVGDMTDPVAVGAALADADAVIHCAAVVSLGPDDVDAMIATNAEGARVVLGLAAARDLDPIVHLSSTSALFEPGAGPLTVDHPPTSTPLPYGRTKAACERVARDLQADGSPVAIVYPSGVIGPAAGSTFGETGDGVSGFVAGGVMPTHDAAMSVIDVRDLAAIITALVEPGRGPRRVMCGGHLLDMAALAEIFRRTTGRRFPMPHVPPGLLRGIGRLADKVGAVVKVDTGMTEEGMTVVTRWEGTVDSDLAEFGIELRDPLTSFAEAIAGWHQAGLLTDKQAGDAATPRPTSTAPAPAKGYRVPGSVLVSKPFRAIGPKIIPPFHRGIARLTGGRTLLDSDAQPMMILTTTGAKSGQPRETPLAAVPIEGGGFLVVGSNFAREHHPAWTANLIANPEAEVLFRGTRTPVRAHLLTGEDRDRRWSHALGWFPGWADYDAVTEREIRLFELRPVTSP